MTTYGFIGAGNMAGAIVRGAIAAGTDPASIWLTSAHDSAARLAEKTGARHEPDAEALAAACDVVVLAVKPRVIPAVAARIFDAVADARPLVVSIAAGIDLARLESLLPEGARVVRAMPNMAAGVGQSMTALAAGAAAGESDLAAARALMDAVGRTMVIAEEDFPTFVGLAGSSPAFVFTFIDALARAGVLGGIPKAQAVEIAAQAVLGSARAVQVEAAARADGGAGRTPADLVDAVCSPGGTTVAGLVAMERAGFSNAVIEAVRAVVAADRELAG
mgnify:FL=1